MLVGFKTLQLVLQPSADRGKTEQCNAAAYYSQQYGFLVNFTITVLRRKGYTIETSSDSYSI